MGRFFYVVPWPQKLAWPHNTSLFWTTRWQVLKFIFVPLLRTLHQDNPIWMFPKIVSFPPKSSILIRFSIINHPFWGTLIFGNTHMSCSLSFSKLYLEQLFWKRWSLGCVYVENHESCRVTIFTICDMVLGVFLVVERCSQRLGLLKS